MLADFFFPQTGTEIIVSLTMNVVNSLEDFLLQKE